MLWCGSWFGTERGHFRGPKRTRASPRPKPAAASVSPICRFLFAPHVSLVPLCPDAISVQGTESVHALTPHFLDSTTTDALTNKSHHFAA